MAKRRRNYPNNNNNGAGRKEKWSQAGKRVPEISVKNDSIAANSMPHVITDSKASNDPSWYTHIYPLAKDVASLSFNIPTGQIFDPTIDAGSNYPEGWDGEKFFWTKASGMPNYGFNSVPGIMVMEVAPILGQCMDPNDAANLAAQQQYTLVRKANSGAINYDKTDLMMLNLAMDSAYMLYEYLLRGYRTFGMYKTMNRYMPDALLDAQGFSPSLYTQLANFRTLLDMFAYNLASINVPDQFDFIRRHSWLFTNVYKDSPLDKASMYLFRPDGFYVWTEGVDSQPTYLDYKARRALFGLIDTDLISSLDQIKNAIDTIMMPILGSQDVGTISGDLAKAFGEGGMIKIKPVEDHEALLPVFDMEVISQIENANIFHKPTNLQVTQHLDNTIAGPYLKQDVRLHTADAVKRFIKPLLNLHIESPTPEDVVVATRFIGRVGAPRISNDEASISYFEVDSLGTEIITSCFVYQYSLLPGSETQRRIKTVSITQEVPVCDLVNVGAPIPGILAHNLAEISTVISAFAHHPTIYLIGAQTVQSTTVSSPGVFAGTIQDYDNYVWLESDTIRNLNDAAVLSEFAVKDYPNF